MGGSALKKLSLSMRNEGMRIGGEKVFTDEVIEVFYPYTQECVGTVPAGAAEHAARAFEIAAGYKSCLLYTSPSPRDQRGSRMPSSA